VDKKGPGQKKGRCHTLDSTIMAHLKSARKTASQAEAERKQVMQNTEIEEKRKKKKKKGRRRRAIHRVRGVQLGFLKGCEAVIEQGLGGPEDRHRSKIST